LAGDSVAVEVVWSATGGTISAAGVYTAGPTPGTYDVTASGEGRSGTATLAVAAAPQPPPPPPGGAWPNEPAGLTVRTDWGLDQVLPTAGDVPIPGSPGWHVAYGFVPGPANGWAQLVADPTAPF